MTTTAHTALQEVNNGKFVRTASGFREIISSSHPIYKPAANRYHLYISLACPWANRCYSMLHLKGLTHVISVSIVHPTWQRTKPEDPEDTHTGWVFNTGALSSPTGMGSFTVANCTEDSVNHAKTIRQVYALGKDTFGKNSVPVLWDKETNTIVNNESSEIIRMFNSEFNEWANGTFANHDFYPETLRAKIDEANEWIYPGINDGVYRCGFAKTQQAYDEAIEKLVASLDRLEELLSRNRFVVGDLLTEADVRLFMTLVRFDEVYVVYFKCNVKRIADYPNIHNYCRELFQFPEINQSIDMNHIKTHYFTSHPPLNTYAIVPRGPNVISDLLLPHNRNLLNKQV